MQNFKAAILAALACAACVAADAPAPAPDAVPTLTANDILNVPLNLECVEAQFYSWAAFGEGLSDERLGGGPAAVGGRKADLSDAVQQFAEELASNEIAHVDFLRVALGDEAVACPAANIGTAFADVASAALGMELSPDFDPYADDVSFLLAAFLFEDVGVTMLGGAIAPLMPLVDAATLTVVATAVGAEAYHGGVIRAMLRDRSLGGIQASRSESSGCYGNQGGLETPFGTIEQVAGAFSDLRDSVDGPEDLDQGIVDEDGSSNLVPTNEMGFTLTRTLEQVLPIVYGGPVPGGFLPEGVNGVFQL